MAAGDIRHRQFYGNNLDATTSPGITDDLANGREVGALWLNRSTNQVYLLSDDAIGAAFWEELEHRGQKGAASGYASLDGSTKVVQNPASAQTTNAASKIPISGLDGLLAPGWLGTGVNDDSVVLGGDQVFRQVGEGQMALVDVTDLNATTGRHGFLPKLDNVASHFLNGQGNYTTGLPGAVAGYQSVGFSSQTSVNVVHNLGGYPVVQILDNTGAVLIPLTITNNSLNDFTVTFAVSTTGTIIYTSGSPGSPGITTQTDDYDITASDRYIFANGAITVTLPTAVGIGGRQYTIKRINAVGTVVIATTGGQTIDGNASLSITTQHTSIDVVSDNSDWRIV